MSLSSTALEVVDSFEVFVSFTPRTSGCELGDQFTTTYETANPRPKTKRPNKPNIKVFLLKYFFILFNNNSIN